MEIVWVVVD